MKILKDIDIIIGISEKIEGVNNSFKFSNDGDVHGLIYGNSGTGKTTLIKYIIGNLRSKHTKEDLSIYVADGKEYFKNNKFVTRYQKINDFRDTVIFYSQIKREVEKRLDKFKSVGAATYYDYNTVKAALEPEEMMPRIFVFHDDFSMESEKVNGEYIEQVYDDLQYILMLGRTAGINIIMSPRSFKGIDDKLESLFTLRIGFKSSTSLSSRLLKSGIGSSTELKNVGECYVKSFAQSQIPVKFIVPLLKD
ncbi:hypothetical protein JYG23_14540 [Sedimentibacter sp. zth1]|uniref:FtsK/SpoIIIE domain-containing protein n=1 Tax=Sedimentibacter sp. zth1 TaxID=2816908 RepID=UPI001A920673|nr:FtsK/SpoIIIE domain-containing protein [Sedimentibacter sp. zth1]QSX05860.1 hypothetical protein JYG23_14540 [Sedimentibacter sp. zth1]